MRTGAGGPLSSAFGTIKTVDAKFWPWLERAILRVRFVKPLEVVPFFPPAMRVLNHCLELKRTAFGDLRLDFRGEPPRGWRVWGLQEV